MYHSVALLLTDGRILVAGGGRPGALGESTELKYLAHHEVEIFSPPYLFNADGSPATRPAITSAPPDNIVYGQTFNLSVSNISASQIQQVVLVRLPSVTHALNFDQQRIVLGYQVVDQQTLSVTAPANATYGPPGPYMLFVIGPNGVPSVAKIVLFANTVPVTLTATPQVSSITYGQSVSITAQLSPSVSTPAPTGTISVKEGGVVVQTATVSGAGSISIAASNLTVGNHVLTVSYSGDAIFQGATAASFSVTVNPATLTVTGNDASRLYGDANPAFTGTIAGLQNGDNITAIYSTTAVAASNVGTYPINLSLSDPGNRLGNYNATLHTGVLTVTAAPLQVTANNKTRMYADPNPPLDGTITGIRNGDNITAQYSTTATVQSLVGTYPITSSLSDPSNKLGNYAVTLTSGTLTVTRSNLSLAFPNFNPSQGTYAPGQAVTMTEVTSSAAVIHYTTDGSTPTAASPVYTGPIVLQTTTTLKAIAMQPEYRDSGITLGVYTIQIPVSATPASQSLLGCGSVNYAVSIPTTNGVSGSVPLSVSGLPTGATATFSPASIVVPGSSTMMVTTSPTTPSGTYQLTITATGSTLSGSTKVNLVVQDFTLSVLSASQTIAAGASASYTLSDTAVNGFSGSVGFTLSGLPVGASATFTPASIGFPGSSTLTIATTTSTPIGTYTLTTTGTSGCRTHDLTLTLIVNAPPPTGPGITVLSTSAGPVGTAVTITGVNFGATQGASTVTFNGIAAQPTAWSNTSITVAVPRGAKTGNVVVTAGGQISNGVSFTVQDDALHIFGTNCATCGWQITDFTIQTSPIYNYTIRTGDILYFYESQNASSVAGIEVCFPSGEGVACADNGLTVDQDNKPVHADTITGVTHFRRVDLSPNAGQILSQISFHSHGTTQAGRWDVYFSNIQIVSADGSVRSIFVTGSAPSLFRSTSFGVTGAGFAIEHNHVW